MKNSAFTLIELLVVIVIIGILATIGIAQFNSYQEQARLAKIIAFGKQVETKMLTEATVNESDVTMWYDFEEAGGTIANDKSSSGNNASITTPSWDADRAFEITDTPDNSQASIHIRNSWVVPTMTYNPPIDEISISFYVKFIEAPIDKDPAILNLPGVFKVMAYGGIGNLDFSFPGGRLQSGKNLKENTWQHIFITHNGIKAQIYLDGELIASDSLPLTSDLLYTSSPLLHIGGAGANATNLLIDNLIISPIAIGF